jgi:hypothetical protein
MSHKPEKLLLRIPKQIWFVRHGLAFCVPRNSVTMLFVVLTFAGCFLFILDFYVNASLFAIAIHTYMLVAAFSFLALAALPTIFIRKDCSKCLLSFHILAHERNHLLLNSRDEALVEEEALKQTGKKLIPILLSNPKLCKDCVFPLRKIYTQVTFNYLKEKKEEK